MKAEIRGVVGKLRDSHHRIAQMMAMGWTDSQIRRVTGITPRRLALYRADPAMQDIVAKYSRRAEEGLEEFADFFNELMICNRVKGELLISDKFDDALDGDCDISLTVIDKIVQGRADRTGYGKTSKVEHKHDFATRLENAIARSGVKIIEGQALEAAPGTSVTPISDAPCVALDSLPNSRALDLPKNASPRMARDNTEPSVSVDSSVQAREQKQVAAHAPEPPNFSKVLGIKRQRLA